MAPPVSHRDFFTGISVESINFYKQKLAVAEAQLGAVTAERDRLEVKVVLLQRQLAEMNVSLYQMQALLNAEKTRAANLGAALSATTSALLRYEMPAKVVEEINKARASMGLSQVKLINLTVPLFRAAYLLQHGFFSHYDLEHPGYWFAKLDGGLCGFDEDIAMSICPAGCNLLKEAVENTRTDDLQQLRRGLRPQRLAPRPLQQLRGGVGRRQVLPRRVHALGARRQDGADKGGRGRVTGVFLASPDLKPPFYAVVFRDVPSRSYLVRGFYDNGNQTGFYQLRHEPVGGGWHKVYINVTLPNDGALYTVVVVGTNNLNYTWIPLSPCGQWRPAFCRIADYTAG